MMEKWLQSCLLIGVAFCSVQGATSYFGKYIGPLHGYHHEVQGEVYAVDARTLHIKDFTYDGQGPAAFFWVGSSSQPDTSGFALRDEKQSGNELKQYRKKSVTLSLPEGKSLNQIKWLSIWCESAQVNFGDVRIPKGFDYPRPQKIGQLAGVHGVSSDPIVIVDAQTLLVPNFSYDGEAPDAKFWVGTGPHPSPRGIRVPDENGKEEPLRRYNRKTIVLTLPADLTVFEIGHFGVWCEAFTVDFGHLQIPANANIPPSLKMLGVSPQTNLVGQNVVNKIIEKVNVLFSIDPPSRSSSAYQQPQPTATNHQYQQYQPTPTTIFHSFQQQYQQQFHQNPYASAIQNPYAQPTIYSPPTLSYQLQNNHQQTQSSFAQPALAKYPLTFVPHFSTGQVSQNYPFNLLSPQVLRINQQYEGSNNQEPSGQSTIYNTQDIQQLIASLPPSSHRLGPVSSHQKTTANKEDKVTTYKPPSLDIHRFITQQQLIQSNKNKRNNNDDNVQIVQSISYDGDQTFEPSDKHEVVVASPLKRLDTSESTIRNESSIGETKNETKRETRRTKESAQEVVKNSEEKEVPPTHTVTPYISDPVIELKEALIYDPVSRTYKEENLFYKQNHKGAFERYESKKNTGEKNETDTKGGRHRKRLNRRIYTEDIEEINKEYNKYLPEVSQKFQDISLEEDDKDDESLSKYAQDAYLDEQYNTQIKQIPIPQRGRYFNQENGNELYRNHALTTKPKKYEKNYSLNKKENVIKNTDNMNQTPNYEDESNINGAINEALSYRNQDHDKYNRQTSTNIEDPNQNYYDSQNLRKPYKPPRVLTEEYFNTKPTETYRPNNFNDEGIIQKLPLEKEIDFNIPASRINNYPETGKSAVYYPQYNTAEQYYEDVNRAKEYPKRPSVANDDYNEPPTNTDYYDQPQQYNDYSSHKVRDEDYQQLTPLRHQANPKPFYNPPISNYNIDGSIPKKINNLESQRQSPAESPDYYQYPDTTEPNADVDDEKASQYNSIRSPKSNTEDHQTTTQSYPETSSPTYSEDTKSSTERYKQAAIDYYDQPNRETYEDSLRQKENYYEPERQVYDDTVQSTPESYGQEENIRYQQEYEPQNTQSRVSSEVYSDDPKMNYEYWEKPRDNSKYSDKPSTDKKKDSLTQLYYSQFKTAEETPSSTGRPQNYLRYEVKDDIINKYYTANDGNRIRAPIPSIEPTETAKSLPLKDLKVYYKPENIPFEPSTSTEITINLNSDNTITPKYHFESNTATKYEIPASSAVKDEALFKIYKQNLMKIQERNLQIQEKAHKERENQIQQQVYEQYKRQQAISTIPPSAVPHLKTPVNVEITSY